MVKKAWLRSCRSISLAIFLSFPPLNWTVWPDRGERKLKCDWLYWLWPHPPEPTWTSTGIRANYSESVFDCWRACAQAQGKCGGHTEGREIMWDNWEFVGGNEVCYLLLSGACSTLTVFPLLSSLYYLSLPSTASLSNACSSHKLPHPFLKYLNLSSLSSLCNACPYHQWPSSVLPAPPSNALLCITCPNHKLPPPNCLVLFSFVLLVFFLLLTLMQWHFSSHWC